MAKKKKWKIYLSDIIFSIVSLSALVYSTVGYWMELQPRLHDYVPFVFVLCVLTAITSLMITGSKPNVRSNMFFTEMINYAIWWVTMVVSYVMVDAVPKLQAVENIFQPQANGLSAIGETTEVVFFISAMYFILAFVVLPWAFVGFDDGAKKPDKA